MYIRLWHLKSKKTKSLVHRGHLANTTSLLPPFFKIYICQVQLANSRL